METVKGFKDVLGEEARKREIIRGILVEKFKLYGFEPAETPTIEYEEFVRGENTGDEAVSDIFKLQDKGKRKLALRYEFTFQLKRLMQNRKLPYKRYEIGRVFRDEPIKSGRYREFTQCDVDIVGSSEISSDAEIMSLVKEVFQELKIPAEIQVNNRKLLNAIIEKVGVRDKKTSEEIIKEVDKLKKNREEVYNNLKKLLGKEEKVEELLDYFEKPLDFFISQGFEGASELEELKKLEKLYGFKTSFAPSLARGLSYYTGNIFEVVSSKYELSIAGGGRYEIFGIPAVGIGFGLDRLAELAKIETNGTKVLVLSIAKDKEAITLATKLRNSKISATIMYGKITKALEFANSCNIPCVIFLGEEEVKKKKLKLRDMKTGKEKMLSEKDLLKELA